MALTEYDKKTLSASQQAGVAAATQKWNEANARGDAAGMAAAHAEPLLRQPDLHCTETAYTE